MIMNLQNNNSISSRRVKLFYETTERSHCYSDGELIVLIMLKSAAIQWFAVYCFLCSKTSQSFVEMSQCLEQSLPGHLVMHCLSVGISCMSMHCAAPRVQQHA